VISEVRRAKTAMAEKFGFDVLAMIGGLRELDRQQDATEAVVSADTDITRSD
jgi:hypothetical protein